MPNLSKTVGVTHQKEENNVMYPSPGEAKLEANSSLDDALDSLTDALSTLRHSVERSQQPGSQKQQTKPTLPADAADELRAVKSLISEARKLMKDATT